jgi:hypothetical protein
VVSTRLTYCFSSALALITVSGFSQETDLGNIGTGNQAVVTIVGNAPESYNTNDFVTTNSNPYAENTNNAPKAEQELTAQNQNIEPTLENGFHMRFELNSQQAVEPAIIAGYSMPSNSSSSSASGSSSSGKVKRHSPTMAERTFNAKKRFRSWMPKRKKKYHPHLCGRF